MVRVRCVSGVNEVAPSKRDYLRGVVEAPLLPERGERQLPSWRKLIHESLPYQYMASVGNSIHFRISMRCLVRLV